MPGCCDPRGCDGVFGDRFARHVAARYRKRGLGRTEQRIVDFLAARKIAFRLSGRTFRTFAHPPARMLAVLAERGLTPVYIHRGAVWHIAGLQRIPA